MSPKTFTPEQATSMLPLLVRITREIRMCTRLRDRFARWVTEERADLNHTEIFQKLERLKVRIDECNEEIALLGCELGVASSGVVNFPSEVAGREITLTWSAGESTVSHFFEADETHLDRRPIEGGPAKARESSVS